MSPSVPEIAKKGSLDISPIDPLLQSPAGTAGNVDREPPVVPSGLRGTSRIVFHGLTPMATTCRHFVAAPERPMDLWGHPMQTIRNHKGHAFNGTG